jgi:hypothetical protein
MRCHLVTNMKPVKFHGSNVVFAENQKEYLPLPAHRTDDGRVTSCWQLSFKERIKTLFSGRLYIQMLTFNAPLQPLLPTVENPIE